MSAEEKKVELTKYIQYMKEEVESTENPKPRTGFWIGVKSLEIAFEAITEISKEGELKTYVLLAGGERREQFIQTIKIDFVTQDLKPEHMIPINAAQAK
jgi:hypothetical protein